ncbi:hypothetical protein R1flu_001901 [Riccia fluitans]|uniref:Myb-like domain-containing protein n=1 Tax=Riccia fluitans TaxID=41844 RepID=A0ABD1Y4K9_9MARC
MDRSPCYDKANVNKGPWSPAEDALLKSFIEENGTGGNWITLPRKAGFHPYPQVMEDANGALSLPITLQGEFENQYQQQQQMRTGFVTDNVDETFRNRLLEIQNLLEGDIVAGRTTTSNSDISMDERFRNPDVQ